jgi:RNA polymerase sigma-70 factor, ECF subfamily
VAGALGPIEFRHKTRMANVITSVQPAGEIAVMPADAGPGIGFDAIFREHYPRIVALLARLTGDPSQAEEIAADVFCKVSEREPLGLADGDPAPWLYRVATNAGLDALRSTTRRRRREEAAGVENIRVASQDNALDDVLREERCTRVREVLGGLKPRDAQLLLLRAEGLAYRELAEALGVQPGSVGTLLARAETEFEKRFRARYGEDL